MMMEDGRWKMEDGRWKMEDGRWKMEDGRWENGEGLEPFWTRTRQPATCNQQLRTRKGEWERPTSNFQRPTLNYERQMGKAGRWMVFLRGLALGKRRHGGMNEF
jgi:hypothetical protein